MVVAVPMAVPIVVSLVVLELAQASGDRVVALVSYSVPASRDAVVALPVQPQRVRLVQPSDVPPHMVWDNP